MKSTNQTLNTLRLQWVESTSFRRRWIPQGTVVGCRQLITPDHVGCLMVPLPPLPLPSPVNMVLWGWLAHVFGLLCSDAMMVSHLPYGPTAMFSLSNCVMRHDIEDRVRCGGEFLRRTARGPTCGRQCGSFRHMSVVWHRGRFQRRTRTSFSTTSRALWYVALADWADTRCRSVCRLTRGLSLLSPPGRSNCECPQASFPGAKG